jgi:hypothetical protein
MEQGGTASPVEPKPRSWAVKAALWVLAIVLAGAAMVYQRATGPTYPVKRTVTVAGKDYRYEFLRSHETTAGAPVQIVFRGKPPKVTGILWWRRYPTKDDFEPVAMQEEIKHVIKPKEQPQEEKILKARLPKQPAAGKIEYYVTLGTPEGQKRLPPGEQTVVLRYKDPVPNEVLIPHVTAMILVIIVGLRAALSALFDPATTRRYAWAALILMTLGGMTLGPLVQKYAFGEYWTGFPWGGDWTDNKMLFMWLAWLVACVVLGAANRPATKIGRATTVLAAVVMTVVYLIPHSMGGSQLDYSAVEKGADPKEAIRTGRQ